MRFVALCGQGDQTLHDRYRIILAHRAATEARIEALQKAEDVIEELFTGNPHQKRIAVDEQTREILQQLAERVYGGFVDKAVITTTDGVKATVKSTGSAAIGIAIERSETKKEKKEI